MSATDLPGESGGTYTWSTTSTKIRLVNTSGAILAVEALTTPSAARDSEIITVVRTAADGSTKTKNVLLTVAKVTFEPATTQLYGYDNFDTPLNLDDDHVSIKSAGETFIAVKIDGGALGSDFDFACDSALTCTVDPAAGSAAFDLHLRAKTWQKKSTVLSAKIKCPTAAVFAKITVHVYTEKVVRVVVAKVADNRSAGTALNFATADYAAHQTVANDKLKEAVVKYEITNSDAANAVKNIAFDIDSSGALTFDINGGGGPGFELIKRAVTATTGQFRVVIVRKMRSFYYVDRAVRVGSTSISLRGTDVFKSMMRLGNGATQEIVEVTHNTGNIAHLAAPLAFNHPVGETMEFPAAAWSSDPIIIAEGNATLDVTKWTILHEVGHSALELQDIDDATDFMHHDQGNTDYRLRFCERNSHYTAGDKENQWEKIPRPLPERPRRRR